MCVLKCDRAELSHSRAIQAPFKQMLSNSYSWVKANENESQDERRELRKADKREKMD